MLSEWQNHKAQLRSYVYKRVDDASAVDDILQDVYIKASSNLHQLKSQGSLKGWLYKIAYNTIMDLLVAGTPSVVIPFEGSGETEQLSRAIELEQQAVVQVVNESELTPERLATAMQKAIQQTPQTLPIDNRGAQHSAQQLIAWANANAPLEDN